MSYKKIEELIKVSSITLNTIASPPSAKVGDKITYMLQIIVPKGVVANNIRVQDIFSVKLQEFIEGSVLLNGFPVNTQPTVVDGALEFPVILSIDATTEEVIQIYSFDVRIKNARLSDSYVDKQQNNSQIIWDNNKTGEMNIEINNKNIVYVGLPILRINKTQNNITQNTGDTISDVNFSGEDILNYKISIYNVGTSTAYYVVIKDLVADKFNIDINSLKGTKGNGEFLGNELTWDIDFMKQGESVLIEFNVTGKNNLPITSTIENSAEITFNSNDNDFGKVQGPIQSNVVDTQLNNLNISVVSSKKSAQIGEKVQYIITFKLGKGSILDDAEVYDLLPIAQEFVIGSATKQINLGEIEAISPNVSSIVDGQKILFPKPIIGTTNEIDASEAPVTVKYTFTATIKSGANFPIYTQIQTNMAGVNWTSDSITKETVSNDTVTVNTSTMNIIVEHKNFTVSEQEGKYTTEDILATIGDIIYYKITINLDGRAKAYNLQIQNILNEGLSFLNTITTPIIGNIIAPNESQGGIVQWNIDTMESGNVAVYEFSTKINNSALLGSFIKNNATIKYSYNNLNNITYNLSSNILNTIVNGLKLKSSAVETANIGEEITYNVSITVPRGKTIYNLRLRIHLDPGQKYIGNTWTSSLGTPGITNVSVQSTNIEYVERQETITALETTDLIIRYTFLVRVTSAKNIDPYIGTQKTMFNLRWSNSLGGTRVFPVIDEVDIVVGRPVLELQKSQRNKTTGGEGPFNVIPLERVNLDDEIEYSFLIRNIGKANANNIIVIDNIPSALTIQKDKSTQGINVNGQEVTYNLDESLVPNNISTVLINTIANKTVVLPENGINEFTAKYSGDVAGKIILPQEISTQVGFYYVNPILTNRIIDSQSRDTDSVAFVGDIVNYQTSIKIPKGSIAYNVQLTYTLNPNEQYIPGTLQTIGGKPLEPGTPTLNFPNEGTIDATSETKYVVYNFDVRILSVVAGANQETQANTSTLTWDSNSLGNPGPTLTKTFNIFVTPLKLAVNKTQSEDGIEFVDTNIAIGLRENIYFKLEIHNPTSEPIYNVTVNDNLPNGFSIQYISSIETTSELIIDSNLLSDSSVFEGTIPILNVGETAYIIYLAKLVGPTTPGKVLSSYASIKYSLDVDTLTTIYGPINSNSIRTEVSGKGLEFDKEISTVNGSLGTVVEYTLTAKVPRGMIIYDVEISDVLPYGEDYLKDATLNGNPVDVTQFNNSLTFPTISEINNNNDMFIFKYVYSTKISRVMNTQPFEEIMKNNAQLKWKPSSGSLSASILNASTEINVKSPNVRIEKYQKNSTKNGIFQMSEINVETGDIIEFKLFIQNTAPGSAYNLIATDTLNQYIQFLNVVSNTLGNIIYNNNTNQVIWTINELSGNTFTTAKFQAKVKGGIVAYGTSDNSYSVTYNTNLIGSPTVIGPIESFPIKQRYPNLSITVSNNKNTYVIGDIITYNILVNIPLGIEFYNLQVQDILPVGQKFIASKLNGVAINPIIQGQLIKFPVINYGMTKLNKDNYKSSLGTSLKDNKILTYEYEIKSEVKSANLFNKNFDIQTDSASITWSVDREGTNIIGPLSTITNMNIGEKLVSIEKFQRIKSVEEFSKNNLDIYTGQEVEYKLIITNIGKSKAYNIKVQDTINNNIEFIQVESITQGSANLNSAKNNILIWNRINELDIGQQQELVYSVKSISSNMETISNIADLTFAFDGTNNNLVGLSSNEVLIQVMGEGYTFNPDRNSYLSNVKALSYGIIKCKGKLGYILTNSSEGANSYNLEIDSIPFHYKLFINNNFVKEIKSNSIYNEVPQALTNVQANSINIIEIVYYVPDRFSNTKDEVNFNVNATLIKNNDTITINSIIKLGMVDVNLSYNISEYSYNPNLFSINYNININVTKGIKIYDLQLYGLYSPSFIFKKAYKDNTSISVINLSGQIVYPYIDMVDATDNAIKLQYSYEVLQYKKTPLSIGALEGNKAILTIRTAKNIEDKCMFEKDIFQVASGEELECIYSKKVFGRCVQYYYYKDIKIPQFEGYIYKNIIFNNPEVIDESLSITPSDCDKNFSKIKYDFTISYKIVYEGCGCSSMGTCLSSIKEIQGTLEKRNLEVTLYTPNYRKDIFNVISNSIVKNITFNKNKTMADVCMAIINSSISNEVTLIKKLGECTFIYCCSNC